MDLKQRIEAAAGKKLLYLPHAIQQMNKSDRMISIQEVREIVITGEIIEDYPEDVRGHSCLLLGRTSSGRVIHVVCSPKNDYLAIVTAYIPSLEEWKETYRERKKRTI